MKTWEPTKYLIMYDGVNDMAGKLGISNRSMHQLILKKKINDAMLDYLDGKLRKRENRHWIEHKEFFDSKRNNVLKNKKKVINAIKSCKNQIELAYNLELNVDELRTILFGWFGTGDLRVIKRSLAL